MPFPMAHLCIAENILNRTSEIVKPGDFLLGSIAPDAVHFRQNYNNGMKKASHLCDSNEEWGNVTNISKWTENVMKFLETNNRTEGRDFIYGYCAHILADIGYVLAFRKEHPEQLDKDRFQEEAAGTDFELYRTHGHREWIWELLRLSKGYGVAGVADLADIGMLKAHVLSGQYQNRMGGESPGNKYVTTENLKDFIAGQSETILQKLFASQ